MVTDADYNAIADDVYSVDSKKTSRPYQIGDTLASGKCKILKAEDTSNSGMQARTVGAIKGGEVGKSHIMIIYVKSSYLLAS
ncbi:hypothetical protein RIM63_04895 [Streptococcus equi subsp. zooepidemicus]|uniref:hypothetical protein n=1 Tax=Streptococcus equi TaxID=1336 RepID=UPI00294B11AE|nr:hypothetical protein [Streptococcus equi]WOK58117.1 hypothetical protein RIM63_04895 [Streptococcus equi subsp. zooepidemicus]HEK9097280.1 hypothetical protein [Streptococcus equi subsp. zooepidemicus]